MSDSWEKSESSSEEEEVEEEKTKKVVDPNVERPTCSWCKKDILDNRQLFICKGPCKQIAHYTCALK